MIIRHRTGGGGGGGEKSRLWARTDDESRAERKKERKKERKIELALKGELVAVRALSPSYLRRPTLPSSLCPFLMDSGHTMCCGFWNS